MEKESQQITQLFAQGYNSIFTSKTKKLNIVENDPDDNKLFECAVSLGAKYIISGDKEVLSIENYMGIKVFTPSRFIDEI
ncbi:MAG: hypothetical protein HQK84_05980 [Nitrospinae bacterium]|nr:hypothetical protein [Nitrospinota bacterium]